MSMIKCKSCYNMTSDSNGTCTYCGEKLFVLNCPKCKSKNITFTAKEKVAGAYFMQWWLGFLGRALWKANSSTRITYICGDCGKKFKIK